MSGVLYCGDNLEVLRECVPEESVDLVYLDPPFNSQRTYNIVYKGSQAQEEAFKDHWSWEEAAPQYFRLLESAEAPSKLRTILRGLHDLLINDDSDLLAYLAMMAPRLFLLHRALKPTGSLYLHCDPTASHYLRLLLDGIFGPGLFRNEVIWRRTAAKGDARKKFGAVHDSLLVYGRSNGAFFSPVRLAPDDEYLARFRLDDDDGRGRYRLAPLDSPNPRPNLTYVYKGYQPPSKGWRVSREVMEQLDAEGRLAFPKQKSGRIARKHYLAEQEGPTATDVWTDIVPLQHGSAERTGFPTQKPLPLMFRVLEASSREGDLVLDPFGGCGTTIEACEHLGRRWIGIDIAAKAVEITEKRFSDRGWEAPEVRWFPPDMDAAVALAKRRAGGQQFEAWILRRLQAVKPKRDRGIDGEAHFKDRSGQLTRVLVSVKSGKLAPGFVRDLRGTMEREGAIGVLVTLHPPSKEMRLEASRAGYLPVNQIPRLQILTVGEIFAGKGIEAPGVNVTAMPRPSVPEAVPVGADKQMDLRLEPPRPPAKSRIRNEQANETTVASKRRRARA